MFFERELSLLSGAPSSQWLTGGSGHSLWIEREKVLKTTKHSDQGTEYPKWGYPDRGYPDRGTVPAIAFKVDILAANVNFMNMDNQAFFNILGTPFEL